MARLDQIFRHRRRVGHDANGGGSVSSADSGRDAPRRIDADLEIGLKGLAVLAHHASNAKLLQPLGICRYADQPASMLGHEVNGFRRDELRRHDQIAFVLAVGIVHDDDHFALT